MTDTPPVVDPNAPAPPPAEAPPAAAPPSPLAAALQAFLDSHSPRKTGHATNSLSSWETDETVYCQCPLCVAGRAALSA